MGSTLNLLLVLWTSSNLGKQAILQEMNKDSKSLFSLMRTTMLNQESKQSHSKITSIEKNSSL